MAQIPKMYEDLNGLWVRFAQADQPGFDETLLRTMIPRKGGGVVFCELGLDQVHQFDCDETSKRRRKEDGGGAN
jgi:hypothetical protein